MSFAAWMYLAAFVVAVLLFFCYSKTGRFLRCVVFTAFSGVISLAGVCLIGGFASISLAVTTPTLMIAALLGVPGVIGMLIFNLI